MEGKPQDRAEAFNPNRCRGMGFGELRGFIDDALDALPGSEEDPDVPGIKEEFLSLADLLASKAADSGSSAPSPSPPAPPAPPEPDPSGKLAGARRERANLRARIEEAWNDPEATRGGIARLERRLKDLEHALPALEAADAPERQRRLEAHRRAVDEHGREMDSWRARGEEARKRRDLARRRAEIAARVRGSVERAFEPRPTGRLRWRPLSRKDATPADIRRHYRERLGQEGRLDRFDQARLDEATTLPYSDWWVPTEGFGGFDAYSVFSFEEMGKVLLECPLYGNAAYVVGSGEESWKDKTKQEMVESGGAERIPHRGEDWPAKIRQALDLG